jgi:hypothetical protein
MGTNKARSIIAAEDVTVIFNDTRVAELARTAKLPDGTDMAALAEGTREAARIFARDARVPTGNELHDEIGGLHKTADRHLYEEVAGQLERLSPRARDILRDHRGARGSRTLLPSPEALRDPVRREAACDAIVSLCRIGVQLVEGRRRPSGKRSRPTLRPLLHAPEPQRNFTKRDAERHFVMLLSLAWLEATGSAPSRTARHSDDSRKVGPFARFARECLRLAGASGADVVEIINDARRRHREMERPRRG